MNKKAAKALLARLNKCVVLIERAAKSRRRKWKKS